jgi:hypothetical protein
MALKGHIEADENISGVAQRRRFKSWCHEPVQSRTREPRAHQTVAASTTFRLFIMRLLWATFLTLLSGGAVWKRSFVAAPG